MDSTISKTTQSLTSAENMRNQTKLIMQPYANWEEFLTPAPLSIAILGELVFISSTTDFSINKNPPKDGYKYIKYPESFRACLMQVCNSGWWAFNEAHTSMDQIRLHTVQVPDYMKAAVKILFQDNKEVIQAHLPDHLNNIRVIADECLTLTTSTEERFKVVIKIIQELLEACVNAEHFYGEEMEAIKKKIEENKLREQSAQETKQRTEKAASALEKELEQARESYNKAMDSLPNGWEMMGMDFVSGLTQSVTEVINGFVSIISQPVCAMSGAATNAAKTVSLMKGQEYDGDVVDKIRSYSKSAEILCWAYKLQELMKVSCKDDKIDWKNLYDQKNKAARSDFFAQQFKRVKVELSNINASKVNSRAEKLCQKGIDICKELAEYAPEGKCDKEVTIIEEVLKLIDSARAFDSKSKETTKSPGISAKPPMMHKNGQDNMRPSQTATENLRFAIEQSRAQLNKTTETYEKFVKNLERNEKELTEILVTLKNCELKEIDFKTTIRMLVKGMDAMGRVKEQWEKMVHFFQMVSNIVKICLNKTLNNFITTSEKTQFLCYSAKLFSKDMIYIQASQACNFASLVHMISETYTDVSSKYLMDHVSSLSKLMAMDKNKSQFKLERQKLQDSCDAAQKGILALVLKNKEEFEKKSTARLEKIDRELLAILPASSPEKTKRIQEAVQSGFNEEEAESYY